MRLFNGPPLPESNCPDSYAYAYDENSGTALWSCGQEYNSDYTITFCPEDGQ